MKNEDKDKEYDDLIIYTSDEEDKTALQQEDEEEIESAQTIEEETIIHTGLTREEEEELDRYEMSKTQHTQPKEKKPIFTKKRVKVGIIVLLAATVLGVLFASILPAFLQNYKENFRRNLSAIMPALFLEEISDEEIANDKRVVSEDNANVTVNHTKKEIDYALSADEEYSYIFDIKRTAMVPLESASDGTFAVYNGGIVCARANSLCYINKSGEIEWEVETSVASPLIKCEGAYILVAENGGNKFMLYKGTELLYDVKCNSEIVSANVSSSGDVVLVVDKSGYKGGVNVYNRYGKEVFVWSSGQNNVLCADISSATRRVAVGLVNADGEVYSVIRTFDITKEESTSAVRFDDTIIFDIAYSGDTITGYGDNSMICMTSSGRVIIDRRYNKVNIAHYAYDDNGNKAILIDSDNLPILQIYNKKGTIKHEITTEELSSHMDIMDNYIIYNSGRDVLLRKGSSAKVNVYTATMDIKSLHIIDSKTFAIVHSNSIEIVEVK